MPFAYLFYSLWSWIASTGITLSILAVIALLIPRVGRFVTREINRRIEDSNTTQEGKSQLAITSVVIYILEMVAYFLIFVYALKALGFSLTGAAIPATVASAAIGLGSQSIIADFLAGFFILTEKQYGVGDWVRFEGAGGSVQGTVIQITMRATRIRTQADETVMIPNSSAKLSINSSNYWSRAVVTMPVPLLGSKSPEEVIERCERAGNQAISVPEINQYILDDLVVQPSVAVTPPSTVGMPWTVSMRLMVQVEAGYQWMVERAIRTAILEEFWNEYGSATTIDGTLRQQLTSAAEPQKLPRRAVVEHTGQHSKVTTQEASDAATTVFPATGSFGAASAHAGEPETNPSQDPAVPVKKNATGDQTADEAAAGKAHTGDTKQDFRTRLKWLLSVHGRVRASTTTLILILGALIFLQASTVEAGDDWAGNDGWLSPNRAHSLRKQPETTPTTTAPPTTSVHPVSPTSSTKPSSTTESSESETPSEERREERENPRSEEPRPSEQREEPTSQERAPRSTETSTSTPSTQQREEPAQPTPAEPVAG